MMEMLAALMFLGQPPIPVDRPLSDGPVLFSTIDHSEWCPAGNVQINLGSGDYTLTRGAARGVCRDPKLVRPILRGRLDAPALAAIRQAYQRAEREGMNACENGKPGEIIVSNGGTPIMVLTNGIGTRTAPQSHSCWSDAALALHRMIGRGFAETGKP